MALEQARAALIQARSIEELKRVADFGAVAVAYARAQDMAKEIAPGGGRGAGGCAGDPGGRLGGDPAQSWGEDRRPAQAVE